MIKINLSAVKEQSERWSALQESKRDRDIYGFEETIDVTDQAKKWYTPSPLELSDFKTNPPKLEEEFQAPAVEEKGSIMVQAGPGSGKTRIAQAKAIQLYNQNIPFTALMFTIQASAELRARLSYTPDEPSLKDRIGTIHSFCLRHLKTVYPDYQFNPAQGDKYGYLLADFLELEEKPHFPCVIVDEIQDISTPELRVINSIASDVIFGVGDPHQSIYQFAGALGEEIFESAESSGFKIASLKYNFRSTQKVIEVYESLFKRNLVSRKDNNSLDNYSILTRNNKEANNIASILLHNNLPCVRIKPGTRHKGEIVSKGEGNIYVMTVHCSKATEYNKTFVYTGGWWQDSASEDNVRYVALSRGMTKACYLLDGKTRYFIELYKEEHNGNN